GVVATSVSRTSVGHRGAVAAGPLVALSPQTGRVVRPSPRFAPRGAEVSVILPDGRGGWWIGGQFGQVGGFRSPNLVHLPSELKVGRRWGPRANNSVWSVVAAGSTLFIGGNFTRVGRVPRKYLAAIDARSGRVLPLNPRPDNGIGSMGLVGTTLYVTGA